VRYGECNSSSRVLLRCWGGGLLSGAGTQLRDGTDVRCAGRSLLLRRHHLRRLRAGSGRNSNDTESDAYERVGGATCCDLGQLSSSSRLSCVRLRRVTHLSPHWSAAQIAPIDAKALRVQSSLPADWAPTRRRMCNFVQVSRTMLLRHVFRIANAGAVFVSTILSLYFITASADSTATRAVGPHQSVRFVNSASQSVKQAMPSATADSNPAERRRSAARQAQADGSCLAVDRPKHTIRNCGCSPGALSGVASIDAAEVIRLLIGNDRCRAPTAPRK